MQSAANLLNRIRVRQGGLAPVPRPAMHQRSSATGRSGRAMDVQAAAVQSQRDVGWLQRYKESLATAPVLTKSMTCCIGVAPLCCEALSSLVC